MKKFKQSSGSLLKIILVEDCPTDADLIAAELKKSSIHFTMEVTDTIRGFESLLENFKPDIILSDYSLPGFDALDIFQIKGDKNCNAPFIIVSGVIGEENAVQIIKTGVTDYVLKDKLFTLNQKIERAIKEAEDITERKRAEEKQKKFEHFFNNSNDLSCIANVDGYFEILNPQFEKLLGYSEEELLKNPFISFIHIDDISATLHELEKLKTGATSINFVNRYRKKNGDYLWFDWSTTPNPDTGKLYAIARDITERKRIEAELIESKELMSLFVEYSPASLAMFDTEMRYIATSRRWMTSYNLADQNIIGKTHYEVFPEIRQEWKDIYKRCLNGAIERRDEDYFTRHDGTTDWLKWEIRPWYKASGEIGGIIIFTEVITAQKESELKFKNLVEKSLVGVYIIQNGKFVYVNPKFAAYLGYTQEEMLNLNNSRQIVCNTDLPFKLKQWRKKVDAGIIEDLQIELKQIRKDGTIIWAELYCGETFYKGAKAILGSFQDITERKNAAIQLEHSEERNRSLIENISDSIILINDKWEVVYQSPSFIRNAGLTFENDRGKTALDIIHPDDVAYGSKIKEKATRAPGTAMPFQLRIFHKKGNFIWIEGTITNLLQNESVNAYVLNYRDVTIRKLMELERFKILGEMLQRNRDLEQFAYIVSHNLRAPVANIIGIAEYLKDEDVDQDEKKQMNECLSESVSALDIVIKDLNTILQTKREISEKKEMIKFSEILNGVKLSIGTLIENDQVAFNSDFSEIDEIVTLKSYLHSIFYNLISNSIKYRQPEITPVIEIRSHLSENKIVLIFKDNGLGIDLEKRRKQVFGLYKRFHTHIEGKGMGLYMVKTQVETLDGKISIKSKIDKGTEFKIVFKKNNN